MTLVKLQSLVVGFVSVFRQWLILVHFSIGLDVRGLILTAMDDNIILTLRLPVNSLQINDLIN